MSDYDYEFDYLEWLEGYADMLADLQRKQRINEHAEEE